MSAPRWIEVQPGWLDCVEDDPDVKGVVNLRGRVQLHHGAYCAESIHFGGFVTDHGAFANLEAAKAAVVQALRKAPR